MSHEFGIYESRTGQRIRKLSLGDNDRLHLASGQLIKRLSADETADSAGAMDAAVIAKKGPPVGSFQGESIPQWLSMRDGRIYYYSHLTGESLPLSKLREGQIVMSPGLIFDETAPDQPVVA
jgi:hypothetical protein